MNDKKQDTPIEATVSATEMVELKRDMQQAKIAAWLQKNQQQLIAVAVVIIVVLIGFSLWKEQQHIQKESASLLYMKAMNVSDQAQREALFDAVIKDYASTGYARLAILQKSKSVDMETQTSGLEILMKSKDMPELAWQARLDLAALHIHQGEFDAAKALLQKRMGKHYEQARYALLAKVETGADEKAVLIQKALDAESHDADLNSTLEAELALLKAAL